MKVVHMGRPSRSMRARGSLLSLSAYVRFALPCDYVNIGERFKRRCVQLDHGDHTYLEDGGENTGRKTYR